MDINIGALESLSDARVKSAASLVNSSGHMDDEALLKASRDFEAIFIKLMLDGMRNTIQKSGFVDGGFAEQIYEDMLFQEYANKMAATKSFGIAEMLYNQLSSYI